MPAYDALHEKKTELIRKSLSGSVFIAPVSAAAIMKLTEGTGSLLAELPEGYSDLGYLSNDGAQFGRDVSSSDVTSWGETGPTRSDITADTTTMTLSAQETKLATLELGTGADLSSVTPDPETGEVGISKPSRPKSRFHRILGLAVDEGDAGEIYVARFLPRAKATSFSEQAYGGGDDPIMWGVTMTGYRDSQLGFSERWIFGGPGWKAILADMGFSA